MAPCFSKTMGELHPCPPTCCWHENQSTFFSISKWFLCSRSLSQICSCIEIHCTSHSILQPSLNENLILRGTRLRKSVEIETGHAFHPGPLSFNSLPKFLSAVAMLLLKTIFYLLNTFLQSTDWLRFNIDSIFFDFCKFLFEHFLRLFQRIPVRNAGRFPVSSAVFSHLLRKFRQ